MMLMGISQIRGYEPGDAEWGVKLETSAARRRRRRRFGGSSRSGSRARRSSGRAASGSGDFSSSARRAPARRCWRRRSRPASTRRSSRSRARVRADVHRHRRADRPLPRAQGEKARRKWAASASSSSTRSTPSGCGAQALRASHGAADDLDCRSSARTARSPERRPHPRDARVARADVRQRAPERRSPYRLDDTVGNLVNQGIFPGMMGGSRPARAEPVARRHGRHRQPAVHRRFLTTGSTRSLTPSTSCRDGSARVSLRLPPPRPLGAQIYFIGATNVPIERLDPR